VSIVGCIIYVKGANGRGVRIANNSVLFHNNTVVGSSGTGAGIYIDGDRSQTSVMNNTILNFSGAGGLAISGAGGAGIVVGNAYYNCTSDVELTGSDWADVDNEETAASPILASGSLTYANGIVYCKPVNTGNVLNATYGQYKGAVRPYASSMGLTAAILKDDEVVDDVTGTLAAGGGGVIVIDD
jgi:hypothetical protein